jgi:transcriptional regulator with XRE-family HTH domain
MMSSSPSPDSSAAEARKALGLRLRQIRRASNITARALSALIDKHHTSISKIENGAKQPTESDVIAWCSACGAEDQTGDLLATLRAVETAYIEWKRSARVGLRRLGKLHSATSYDSTSVFRIHEPTVLPGFLQTEQYIRDAMNFWYHFLDVPSDIDELVEFKLNRTASIMNASRKLLVILGEEALRTRFGTADAHEDQLLHLASCAKLPYLSLGVVPSSVPRWGFASIGFWIFDSRAVALETPTAKLTVTRPQEVQLYARLFEHLKAQAVFGAEARRHIMEEIDQGITRPASSEPGQGDRL